MKRSEHIQNLLTHDSVARLPMPSLMRWRLINRFASRRPLKWRMSKLIVLAILSTFPCVQAVHACGWWGDGEKSDSDALVVRADGTVVRDAAGEVTDALQQLRMGNRYRLGDGVPRNAATAASWYRRAADQGLAGAQYNLAMMYARGNGVNQDYSAAEKLYRLSARSGDVHAQHHLAELYRDGRGVTRDLGESAYWFRAAAVQGHADVFSELGEIYWTGRGLPADPEQAYLWWKLAALNDAEDDTRSRAVIMQNLTPEQIVRVEKLADAWLHRWRSVP